MFFESRLIFKEAPPGINAEIKSDKPPLDSNPDDKNFADNKTKELRQKREYDELNSVLKETIERSTNQERYENDPVFSQRAESMRQFFRVLANGNARDLASKASQLYEFYGKDSLFCLDPEKEDEVMVILRKARMYNPDQYQLYDLIQKPEHRREIIIKCYPRFEQTIDRLKIFELPNFNQACIALTLSMEEYGIIKSHEDLEKWKPALATIQTREHRDVITWLIRHDLIHNPINILEYKESFSKLPTTEYRKWYYDQSIQFIAENAKNLNRVYERVEDYLNYYLLQIPAIDYATLEAICLSEKFSPKEKSEKIAVLFKGKNYPQLIHGFSKFCGQMASFIHYAKDKPETKRFVERSGVWKKTHDFFEKNWKVYDLLFCSSNYYLKNVAEIHGNEFNLRTSRHGLGGNCDFIPNQVKDIAIADIEANNNPLALPSSTDYRKAEYERMNGQTMKSLGFQTIDQAIDLIWQTRQPDGDVKAQNSQEASKLQVLYGRSPFYNDLMFSSSAHLNNKDFLDIFDVNAQIARAYPDLAVKYSSVHGTPQIVTGAIRESSTHWDQLYSVNAGPTPQTREGIARWNQNVSRHDRFWYAGSNSQKRWNHKENTPEWEGFHSWPDEYLVRLMSVSDSQQKMAVATMLEKSEAVSTYFQRLTYRRAIDYIGTEQFNDTRFDLSGGAGDTNGLAHARDVFSALILFAKNPEAENLKKQFFERRYSVYCSPTDPFQKFMQAKGSPTAWSIYDWFEFHGRSDEKAANWGYTEDNQFVTFQGWEHPTFGYDRPREEMKDLKP